MEQICQKAIEAGYNCYFRIEMTPVNDKGAWGAFVIGSIVLAITLMVFISYRFKQKENRGF